MLNNPRNASGTIPLFVAWLTLAAMCILLVFKVNLHSDLLFLDSVAADLFDHGGAWSHWKITPAPAYFPDMLAYALAYFVFPHPPQRIVFVSMVQAMLLAWSCLYLARAIKPSLSIHAKLFVLLVTTAVVLVSAHSSMWLFFNSTNNHFAALIFPLLCLAWTINFLRDKEVRGLLLVACGVAIGTASTSIFTLAFTLPALMFLARSGIVFRAHRQLRQSAFRVAAAVLAGQAAAMLLRKFLLTYDAMEGRPLFTTDAALHALKAFVSATRTTFGAENKYTLALALFLSLCIVTVLIDWVASIRVSINPTSAGSPIAELEVTGKNWAYGLGVMFLCTALPINVIGAVLSGGFGDDCGYRYFAFPIALGMLLFILMLDFKSVFASRRTGLIAALSTVVLACLGLLSVKPLLLQTSRTSYSEVMTKGGVELADVIGTCIDSEASKGFVFGAGIGDFWNARGLSYHTNKTPYILPVIKDATPFFHMMSLGPLMDPRKYGITSYNFAVLRKSGTTTPFDLTPEILGRVLPPPARIVDCANSDSELWLYQGLELDTVVRKKIAQFLGQQGVLHHYQMAAHDLPGTVGRVESLSRIAKAGSDAAGYLTYGPYISVPPGRYQATISYTATEPGNKWDAGKFNDAAALINLAKGDLPPGNREVKFLFETGKNVPGFEIRTWFGGRGMFSVHKIQLQDADPRQVRQAGR